ncbi:TPA: hypothetical protein ACSPJ7_005537 [Bacillus cereus]
MYNESLPLTKPNISKKLLNRYAILNAASNLPEGVYQMSYFLGFMGSLVGITYSLFRGIGYILVGTGLINNHFYELLYVFVPILLAGIGFLGIIVEEKLPNFSRVCIYLSALNALFFIIECSQVNLNEALLLSLIPIFYFVFISLSIILLHRSNRICD